MSITLTIVCTELLRKLIKMKPESPTPNMEHEIRNCLLLVGLEASTGYGVLKRIFGILSGRRYKRPGIFDQKSSNIILTLLRYIFSAYLSKRSYRESTLYRSTRMQDNGLNNVKMTRYLDHGLQNLIPRFQVQMKYFEGFILETYIYELKGFMKPHILPIYFNISC